MTTAAMPRRAMLLGTAALAFGGPALAQAQGIKLMGFSGQNLRGGPIAIPSYQIAYVHTHEGTAQGGVLVKSRLTSVLSGVPETVMRQLADEACADLKAQFQAAGLPLLADDVVQAGLAGSGVELAPNNREVTGITGAITIGDKVRKAHATFGAEQAPMIKGLHTTGQSAFGALGAMGVSRKLAPFAMQQQAVLVMPNLVIDFADSDAKGGRDFLGRQSASVNTNLAFSLAAGSQASLLTSMNQGRATAPGMMYTVKPLASKTPFATVETGAAAARQLSVASVTDSNYIRRDTTRGDAVVVDLPVWEGLVRNAYKTFNAAVVAEFKKARG